ncbi:MAG: cytochrome c family protein [Paracoccaceae bacterium]|jgi:cytochrome c|nr:cytochrome c family protein [Paracoccaceae bacterium]
MFDTMTITKMTAAFCGSLLVFLLTLWLAETLYHVGHDDRFHFGGHHEAAYVIEDDTEVVEDDTEVVEALAEEVDFEVILASANPEKGAKVFSKCKACHKMTDGENGTGPHLYKVVGRDIGSISEYGYSGTLMEMAGVWDANALNGFLKNPKKYAPGTKMGFAGLKKESDRANLISYLATSK